MTLPNFIIFGAIKSGTGALHQYLGAHPQIYASPLKEPRYFSVRQDAPRQEPGKVTTLEDYEKVFEGARGELAVGEASSGYIYQPHAALKIFETLPGVRLIASLRNPVDRAIAHLRMTGGQIPKSVDSLVGSQTSGWANASLYHQHLEPYFKLFNPQQMMFLIFEEWTSEPAKAMEAVHKFLGVDSSYGISSQVRHPAGQVLRAQNSKTVQRLKHLVPPFAKRAINTWRASKPTAERVDSDVRIAMNEWYRDEILRLEESLGRDLSIWKTTRSA